MEDYIEHVKSIAEALGIEKEPVGVKYTDEAPGVEIEAGNYTVCGAILAASKDKIIVLSEESCACSGGKTHLGLTQRGEIPWKMLVEEMRGSLCWSMITYPLVSGNFNVSVGDISARRMERWDPNIMAASIPWERIRGIAEAVEFSTAGMAKPSEEFERMTEKMKSKR
ncbi:MAG: DUF169 domain-containing protein [Euryarchaeota archaeon]|nr:DUF169 domain-containing protein [Euryarchaeota archaeon]